MHGFDGSSVSSNEGLSIAKVGLNRWHAIRALRLPDGRTKCSRGRSTWCLFHHVCSSSRYLSNARSMFQEEGRSAPNPVSIKDTANFLLKYPRFTYFAWYRIQDLGLAAGNGREQSPYPQVAHLAKHLQRVETLCVLRLFDHRKWQWGLCGKYYDNW